MTPAQVRAVLAEIDRLQDTAVVLVAGSGAPGVDEDRLRELQQLGYLPANLPPSLVQDSFQLGKLQRAAEQHALGRPWHEVIEQARALPLSLADRRALDHVELSAGQHLVAMRGGVSARAVSILSPAQAQASLESYVQAVLKPRLAEAVINRTPARALASELGHAAGDWTRDFVRVAHTELHRAHQQGTTHATLEYNAALGRAPDEVYVEIMVRADSCEVCARLYENPDGSRKAFRLTDLMRNGTNAGRRARDWKPVIPPAHPNCVCFQRVALRTPTVISAA